MGIPCLLKGVRCMNMFLSTQSLLVRMHVIWWEEAQEITIMSCLNGGFSVAHDPTNF